MESITRLYGLNEKASVTSRYTEDYRTETCEVASFEVTTTRTVTLRALNRAAHIAVANTTELMPERVIRGAKAALDIQHQHGRLRGLT